MKSCYSLILIGWANTWGVRFNANKCKTMRISRKRDPGEPSYEMDGEQLEATEESTYIGIIIQNDWEWEKQTQHAVTKGSQLYQTKLLHVFQERRGFTPVLFDHI